MKEIKLTRGQVALVDDEDFEWLSAWKWYATVKHYTKAPNQYYATRTVRHPKRTTIQMHRIILHTPEGMDTDHVDGNGLNNQRANLRPSTRSQNGCNRTKQKDNVTGYKGVQFTKNKQIRPFRADIKLQGRHFYLGTYDTAREAAEAYNQAALKLHGEFAVLNTIS